MNDLCKLATSHITPTPVGCSWVKIFVMEGIKVPSLECT